MGYRVYHNGKPCSTYENCKNDTFETKEEAEIFVYMWAFSLTHEQAEQDKTSLHLDVEYVFDFGVTMMIVETIEGSAENWENRKLGCDERFVEVSDYEMPN